MLLQATSPVRLPGTWLRAAASSRRTARDPWSARIPIGPLDLARRTVKHRGVRDWRLARAARSQTKETFRYRENGSMYITKTHVYMDHHNRLAGYPRRYH